MSKRWATVLLVAVAGGCSDDDGGFDLDADDPGGDAAAIDAPPPIDADPDLEAFFGARAGYLAQLAVPIEDCVVQDDTSFPAFHGCIDWHSAVHANWALHAVTRLTGDPSYRETAESVLTAQALAQELAFLEGSGVPGEVPYGYAWFLKLARERALAGRTDLQPHAAAVYETLDEYVRGLPPSEVEAGVYAPQYENLSWAILNLWEQAVFEGDDVRAASVAELARQKLVPHACPLSRDAAEADEFFPACLHRALALTTILPAAEAEATLAGFAGDPPVLPPVVTPVSAHAAGLNFSRAWGLWALWQSGEGHAWRDLYLEHVETWMARPQYWAENYLAYSHWVAQFGVYAIALSYE